MTMFIMDDAAHESQVAGNKAKNLSKLRRAGFNVPRFFVIASGVDVGGASADAVSRELARLGGNRFAVRSSSVEEDGADASFAGQFDSFLDVGPDDVRQFAARVAASGRSDHLDAYRESSGRTAATSPAVIVQEMIEADAAGVAFGADPVDGNTRVRVIAAVEGTADTLVSGQRQGDTWRLNDAGTVVAEALEGDRPVVDDKVLRRIVELVDAAGDYFRAPQDIEWAIKGGELYLLQSRNITTLPLADDPDAYALWDNSNIVESYGGVTTPLTFSVAREAYQEAYRHMGRVLGMSESVIAGNRRAYEQMIGLIEGRVYYNLLNWYRLLMLTPGFRYNRKFMEQMMGVTEGLPASAVPAAALDGQFPKLRSAASVARVAGRLCRRLLTHGRDVRRFHDDLDRILAPADLDRMTLTGLVDYYESLQSRVIPAWDTPLVNDLFCMIFHGALRQLAGSWLDDADGIENDLVAGESGIISLEPVRRMKQLAAIARDDECLVDALCAADLPAIDRLSRGNPAFTQARDDYLDYFGDRCLDELKLESRTLRDDPAPLYRAVGQFARHAPGPGQGETMRRDAEARVADALGRSPVRRHLFGLVLRLARGRIRDRENLRFERTRVYGRVRTIFLEIGRRLAALGALADGDDVFYLEADEIATFVRGTGTGCSLSALASARRHEFAAFRASADLPRRFVTCGPAQLASSRREAPVSANPDGDVRQGQACSKGIVRGPVRIVRDPRQTPFRKGEILVAERTDPGWVTIFPLATAMIMERGSLLSHSAIVARELNIPAVVGVEDACRWLSDGDWVELDGASGMIRRIDRTDIAA